jgi:hypothetical protein
MPAVSHPRHIEGQSATDCPFCSRPRMWKLARKMPIVWRQYCSKCHSQRSLAARKKRNVSYLAQIRQRRTSEPLFRAYLLWHGARGRAKSRGVEFALERSDVERWVLAGVCQATGLKFDLALKRKRMGPLSPSLDRKDPRLGYVPGNVRLVCWLYNRAKGDGTDADVMLLVEAMNAIDFAETA